MLLNSIIHIFQASGNQVAVLEKQEHITNSEIFSNIILTPPPFFPENTYTFPSESGPPVYCLVLIVYKMQLQPLFI